MNARKRFWIIWGTVVVALLGGAYAITSRNAPKALDAPSGYFH